MHTMTKVNLRLLPIALLALVILYHQFTPSRKTPKAEGAKEQFLIAALGGSVGQLELYVTDQDRNLVRIPAGLKPGDKYDKNLMDAYVQLTFDLSSAARVEFHEGWRRIGELHAEVYGSPVVLPAYLSRDSRLGFNKGWDYFLCSKTNGATLALIEETIQSSASHATSPEPAPPSTTQ